MRWFIAGALIALVPAIYIYGVSTQLNAMFDDTRPTVFRERVLEKSESSGRYRTFDLQLGAWGDQPAGSHSVTHDLYDEVQVGSPVCIYRRDGRLWLRWFYVDHCEGWTPPSKGAGPKAVQQHQ